MDCKLPDTPAAQTAANLAVHELLANAVLRSNAPKEHKAAARRNLKRARAAAGTGNGAAR